MTASLDLQVKVDTREPEETYNLVLKMFPSAIKERLDLGDIAYKNIAFELKTWNDFIQSIKDKRFRNQLYNFLINKEVDSYYVIYGDWTEINKFSQIRITAILGAIASIQGRYGINLLTFPNKYYAIYTICKIIEKAYDHKEVRPTTFKILTNERALDMIIASAEKVGVKDARKILKAFGTVKDVVNASKDDLQKVHKVGETKAERMWETFNYDFKAMVQFDEEIESDLDIIDIEKDKVND